MNPEQEPNQEEEAVKEQLGRVRMALLREDSQRAETLFRASSGLCIAVASLLRERESNRSAAPLED